MGGWPASGPGRKAVFISTDTFKHEGHAGEEEGTHQRAKGVLYARDTLRMATSTRLLGEQRLGGAKVWTRQGTAPTPTDDTSQ